MSHAFEVGTAVNVAVRLPSAVAKAMSPVWTFAEAYETTCHSTTESGSPALTCTETPLRNSARYHSIVIAGAPVETTRWNRRVVESRRVPLIWLCWGCALLNRALKRRNDRAVMTDVIVTLTVESPAASVAAPFWTLGPRGAAVALSSRRWSENTVYQHPSEFVASHAVWPATSPARTSFRCWL